VVDTQQKIEDVIEDLDVKLNTVLAKQEYDYLKGYNIYVKKKEGELWELIEKLNVKNSQSSNKDKKIYNLEITLNRIRKDAVKYDDEWLQAQKDLREMKL